MAGKKGMVKEIGQEELLLPELLNQAIMANDQIKYYLTLLQSAQQQAEFPNKRFSTLREERGSVNVEAARLDTVISGSVKVSSDEYSIPLADEIIDSIKRCMEQMLRPLETINDHKCVEMHGRAQRLLAELPLHAEIVPISLIETITSGERGGQDSIHLLVMDLHRRLNALQSGMAQEEIQGAKVYLLGDGDRELVAAFMTGVNRTAPLKFEHPGLGTTATRVGERLVIQNDIGETESHLMIINIIGLDVSIVQTDVHMPRILFFQSLLDRYEMTWEDTLSRSSGGELVEKGLYHLSRGHHSCLGREQLAEFLQFLGSRIVFLIDWNRARKKLQSFLPKSDAITALRWAAEKEVGHRGFLKLGGDQLIFEALEMAPRVPLRYGQPLYQVLGRERTLAFFQSALRKSATDLLAQKPIRLIQDEIKVDLLNYFRPAPQELMSLCIGHATLIFEVGTTLREAIHGLEQGPDRRPVEKDADRSKKWEKEADNIVSRVRTLARSIDVAVPFVDLVVNADDAIDFLEEAMYLVTLAPEINPSPAYQELGMLADIAVASCQEFIKSLYAAERAYDRCAQNEMVQFLHPVDSVIELEEKCDQALRRAMAVILETSTDFRSTMVAVEVARNIEESTNSLMKAAYLLKDNIFDSLGTFEVR
ncbi:MAG: hypothetical protein ABR986_00195 [Methanomassiliicoccales archaeon]|jgi:uncharacterized protein Yka (UPF0111/DUF47 family)